MYCKSLSGKGCLIKNDRGGTEVNPMLIPDTTGGIVEYTFTLDTNEKDD